MKRLMAECIAFLKFNVLYSKYKSVNIGIRSHIRDTNTKLGCEQCWKIDLESFQLIKVKSPRAIFVKRIKIST